MKSKPSSREVLTDALDKQQGDFEKQSDRAIKAIEELSKTPEATRGAVAELCRALGAGHHVVRSSARAALEMHAPAETVASIIKALQNGETNVRSEASKQLSTLTTSFIGLRRLLKEESAERPALMKELLWQGVETLLVCARDPDWYTRSNSVQALGVLSFASKEQGADRILAAIISALEDPNEWVRSAGAGAIASGGWGNRAASAVPVLTKMLRSSLDREAAAALKAIGPAAETARSTLEHRVRTGDPAGKDAAQQALDALDEPSKRTPKTRVKKTKKTVKSTAKTTKEKAKKPRRKE